MPNCSNCYPNECSTSSGCSKCMPGYYLVDSYCEQLPCYDICPSCLTESNCTKCQNCTQTTSSNETTCYKESFLSEGCLPCAENYYLNPQGYCTVCSKSSDADKFQNGSNNGTGKCSYYSNLVANCSIFNLSTKVCAECIIGFDLTENGTCLKSSVRLITIIKLNASTTTIIVTDITMVIMKTTTNTTTIITENSTDSEITSFTDQILLPKNQTEIKDISDISDSANNTFYNYSCDSYTSIELETNRSLVIKNTSSIIIIVDTITAKEKTIIIESKNSDINLCDHPSNSTNSTDSIKSTNSTNSTNSTDSTDSTDSIKSIKSTHKKKSTKSTNTKNSINSSSNSEIMRKSHLLNHKTPFPIKLGEKMKTFQTKKSTSERKINNHQD